MGLTKHYDYTIDLSLTPPSCLPSDLDTEGFIDITRIGDPWRRYLNPVTGKEHDGAVYYAMRCPRGTDQ